MTEVKPFNINGTLGTNTKARRAQTRVPRLAMPTQIHTIKVKSGSATTVIIDCDNGWSLSMRLHNASEWVEPSLKFDIKLIGVPSNMGARVASW